MHEPDSTPGLPYRVVLADDHPVYLDALSRAVTHHPSLTLAGAVTDGSQAVEIIKRVSPDVAVLDVEMPKVSGPAVCALLTKLELPTRVLFLSAHSDGSTVYDALANGGAGYLTKDASLGEIQEAILHVASGARRLGPDVAHHIIDEIQTRAGRETLALTDREQSVLELCAQGLTVVAMGKQLHLSAATVKVHLSTLYAKLGANDRASAVAEALRRGLVD